MTEVFGRRRAVWHQLGKDITSKNLNGVLEEAGLDWEVEKRTVFLENGIVIPNTMATVRKDTNEPLGIVSERYSVVQNHSAFSFVDTLIENGDYRIEKAGTFNRGRSAWLLANTENVKLYGDLVSPYILFVNSHDGTSSLKVIMTPIRLACSNMINLALKTSKRAFSFSHTGDVYGRAEIALQVDKAAKSYTASLEKELSEMSKISFNEKQFKNAVEMLLPISENDGQQKVNNVNSSREDLMNRYYNAPDLVGMPKNAVRFVYAVSDYATHKESKRNTDTYQEKMFSKSVNGNTLIDLAYDIVREVA